MQLAARHSEATDFVIGTGVGHTIREFVVSSFRVVGIDDWERYVRTDPGLFRPVDPNVQLADATKAREQLGWKPTVEFSELVERMILADLNSLPSARDS